MPCSKKNHIQFKMGFRWGLLKLFSQVLHNTRYNYFEQQHLSWKRLWMSGFVVPNIICFQTQKQLATLNNIWILLKSVLIEFDWISCKWEPLCVHVACTLVTMCTICWAWIGPWQVVQNAHQDTQTENWALFD